MGVRDRSSTPFRARGLAEESPTEFQAVQFILLVMVPQLLLAGIIVPRALMPTWLERISNVMLASYAPEALSGGCIRSRPVSRCATSSSLSFAVASLCLRR